MLGIHDLALFIVSGLLLNMMPGPDSLLIMLRSGSQGWRAGSMAALGIGTGTMVHVLAAALGLSALLSASAELFAVIKLMGALYLVYLGVSMLWQRSGTSTSVDGAVALPALSYGSIFRQGLRIPVKLNSDSGICEHHFRKVCGQGFCEQKLSFEGRHLLDSPNKPAAKRSAAVVDPGHWSMTVHLTSEFVL
ncbi:LysE family translocator [Aeromonas caviae]|uniref:LysE family translocator n=1 Tax=Aeromonas caviae TaxID=648 RepID=UPI0029DE6454|nr:LysE family translocator [Aeromonas caviae]MDX7682088.1 LysE family translocator [Aeromonas caviae]